MTTVACPECEASVKFKVTPSLYQRVTCSACLIDLQVVSLSPVELDIFLDKGPDARASGRRKGKMGAKKDERSRKGDDFGGEDDDEIPARRYKPKERDKRRRDRMTNQRHS